VPIANLGNRHRFEVRSRNLLQRPAQIVDPIIRMTRVNDLEHHIVAILQLAYDAVKLLLLPVGCLLIPVMISPGASPCRSANDPVRTD